MEFVIAASAGTGALFLWSWYVFPSLPTRPSARITWGRRLLDSAELYQVSPAGLWLLTLGVGVMIGGGIFAVTHVGAMAGIAAIAAAGIPAASIRARAQALQRARQEAWPHVIDAMLTGVRSGMALPDTVSALADTGPEPLRRHMRQFRHDLRTLGTFHAALERMKERLADPVADRIIEALLCAWDVGGTNLTTLLAQLATMLRADQRTRGELRARQSWTVNGARLAALAPWIVLGILCLQPGTAQTYRSPIGVAILIVGALISVLAYIAMTRIGKLPHDKRTFA